MRNSFIHELELENDRGAVETSFVFFIACFYNKRVKLPSKKNNEAGFWFVMINSFRLNTATDTVAKATYVRIFVTKKIN